MYLIIFHFQSQNTLSKYPSRAQNGWLSSVLIWRNPDAGTNLLQLLEGSHFFWLWLEHNCIYQACLAHFSLFNFLISSSSWAGEWNDFSLFQEVQSSLVQVVQVRVTQHGGDPSSNFLQQNKWLLNLIQLGSVLSCRFDFSSPICRIVSAFKEPDIC